MVELDNCGTQHKEYYASAECMLYCNHKPWAPFFTTGMASPTLDMWAQELQQFNIKFQHIQEEKDVVADMISQLRTLGLYHNNNNEDIPLSTEDVIKNIIEEIYSVEVAPKSNSLQHRQAEPGCTKKRATARQVL